MDDQKYYVTVTIWERTGDDEADVEVIEAEDLGGFGSVEDAVSLVNAISGFCTTK